MDLVNPINGDAFRGLSDHAFWHNAAPREDSRFRSGQVVFCKIDEVWRLFRVLRRTRRRIVLVTSEGDKPVTPALWRQKPPHVLAWFGTNMFAEAPTAHPLPLGLGNADGTVTLQWSEIQSALSNAPERNRLLYANFGTSSNPRVRESLQAWMSRPEQGWITRQPHSATSGKATYLRDLLTHHFVLCPPGNGEDTHRMWEALYCEAIPVVRESPVMRDFQDLPVLFVEDLTAITAEFLQSRIGGWETRSRRKLSAEYWEKQFQSAREKAIRAGPLTLTECLSAWWQEMRRVIFDRG